MSSPAALSLPLHHLTLGKPSIQIPSPIRPPTSSDDISIKEALKLSSAAAKEHKSCAKALSELMLVHHQQHRIVDSLLERRKRRKRKRRKDGVEFDADKDGDSGFLFSAGFSSKSDKCRYLTVKQEAEFSRYIKEDSLIDKKDNYSCDYNFMESTQSASIARMKRMRDDKTKLRARESRERIISSYKKLVVSIATAYQGKGLSLQDLIQEGCIGLLRGAQKFDRTKGYKLSTYVYWWIKQGIVRSIVSKARIIRLPGNLCEAMNKVFEAKSILRRRLGRRPTYEEIGEFVGMSASSIQIIMEKATDPISIEKPISYGLMLKDIIRCPETTPEAKVTKELMIELFEEVLQRFSDREVYIMRQHYGLNGETAKTFEEIGRLLNLSRERIRQIHCSILRRLKEDEEFIRGLREIVV